MADTRYREAVEEVKSRVNIVDIVGDTVRLVQQGNRLLGLCPFHNEKTPSFNVNKGRNMFHCFGCGASGDAIGFVMRQEGLSFPEAIAKLAERYSVRLPEYSHERGEDRQRAQDREEYFAATTYAAKFFRDELESRRYPEAEAYLVSRGIGAETAAQFQLGFAPSAWGRLTDSAAATGVPIAGLMSAGLVVRKDDGSSTWDRFRNRVMFPIVNLSGKVLAFSGRTLDPEEKAKYVNSPETPYYTKGRELFALNVAQRFIREQNTAVLVEGNFDAVSLHAHGFRNVVASLGTALTEQQANLLRRFTEKVVILYDGDKAGRAAANRALEVFLRIDMPQVLYAELPLGTDPDDFVRSQGPAALDRLIAEARPMLGLRIDEALQPALGRSSADAKRQALDKVSGWLNFVRNATVRAAYEQEISRRLELDQSQIRRALRDAQAPQRAPQRSGPEGGEEREGGATQAAVHLTRHEKLLVNLLNDETTFLDVVYREHVAHIVETPSLREFLQLTAVAWAEEGAPTFQQAVGELEDSPLREALIAALVAGESYDETNRPRALEQTLRDLKINWLMSEIRVLGEQEHQAELRHETGRVDELLEQIRSLTRYLRDLKAQGSGSGR
jgi:DNA primase